MMYSNEAFDPKLPVKLEDDKTLMETSDELHPSTALSNSEDAVAINSDTTKNTKRAVLKGRGRSIVLSIESKLELLADVDNKIGSRKEIAAKYGIPSNTVTSIVKNRDKVEKASKILLFQPGRKRMRESNHAEIDRALFQWVRQAQQKNEPVNCLLLAEKAERLAIDHGAHTFKATTGWIHRFKKRHGVCYTKIQAKNKQSSNLLESSGSSGLQSQGSGSAVNDDDSVDVGLIISSIFKPISMDKNAAKKYSENSLQYILDEYQPADIFCADEVDLFFKCLPDSVQVSSVNKCKPISRDKVTCLMGVNMTGIEKLPLLVIGKMSTAPGVKVLPLDYLVEKTTDMTSHLFQSWLQQVDDNFYYENRNIALVINSSQAHSSTSSSNKAVKIVFLPSDTTDYLQPIRQGVSHSFKMHYRTRIVQKYLLHARNEVNKGNLFCADSFKLPISHALFCMRAAWDEVERETIVNSFRQAGFHVRKEHPVVEESAHSHLNHLLERLGQLVPVNTNATAFADVDKELIKTHKEFIESNKGEDAQAPAPVTTSEAMKAVETLKKFAGENDYGPEMFQALSVIEFHVETAIINEHIITPSIKEEGMVLGGDDEDDDDDEDEVEVQEAADANSHSINQNSHDSQISNVINSLNGDLDSTDVPNKTD